MSLPMAVPAAYVHMPPAQYRKETEAMPPPRSPGDALSVRPSRMAAPSSGAASEKSSGAVLSTRRAATVSVAVLPAASVDTTRRS